jgi:hypothetical protein
MLQITGLDGNGVPLQPWQSVGIPLFFYITSAFVGWLLSVVMLRRLSDGPPEMTP